MFIFFKKFSLLERVITHWSLGSHDSGLLLVRCSGRIQLLDPSIATTSPPCLWPQPNQCPHKILTHTQNDTEMDIMIVVRDKCKLNDSSVLLHSWNTDWVRTERTEANRGQKWGCVASLCLSWMLKFCLRMCDIHAFPAYIAPPSGQYGQQHTEDTYSSMLFWILYYLTICSIQPIKK